MHQIIFLKIKHKYDSILQTEKIVQNIMKWYALSFKARTQGQWQQTLSLFVTVSICLSLFLCLTYTGIFVFPEQAHLCMVSQLCNYLAVFFFQHWFPCSHLSTLVLTLIVSPPQLWSLIPGQQVWYRYHIYG